MMMEKNQGQIIKGEIGATHPAKLIYTILKKQKSGVLSFDDGVTKVRMYFKDGCLVPYVKGLKGDKKFTRYLVNNKKVTTDEIKASRKQAKEEKRKTVDVLIEKGILDDFAVKQDATEFYWKSVPGVFAWRHGTFEFSDQSLEDVEEEVNPERTLQEIVQGVRLHYNQGMIQQRLKKRMKSPPRIFKEAVFSLEQLGLSDEEAQFAMALMGGTPIFDALGKVELPHSDAMALAFTLLTLEMIKFKGIKKQYKPRRKRGVLDQAIEAAMASVDRIHEQVSQEELLAAQDTQAPQAAASPEDLQAKLDEMSQIAQGTPQPATPEEFNFDEEFGDLSDADTMMEEGGDDPFAGLAGDGDYADDAALEATSLEEGEGDVSLGDLGEIAEDVDYEEPMTDIGDLDSYQEEPEDFTFNPDEAPQDIFRLGLTYEEQGSYKVARRAFEEAIERNYNSPEVQGHLAWAVFNDTKSDDAFENAAAILQNVIKANPTSHYPYLYLGKMYEQEGDHSMAELYYIKALEMNRDCEEAKTNIKRLHEER